jgi:hypothetical protein
MMKSLDSIIDNFYCFLKCKKVPFDIHESNTGSIYFTLRNAKTGEKAKVRISDHAMPNYIDPIKQKSRRVDYTLDPKSGYDLDFVKFATESIWDSSYVMIEI